MLFRLKEWPDYKGIETGELLLRESVIFQRSLKEWPGYKGIETQSGVFPLWQGEYVWKSDLTIKGLRQAFFSPSDKNLNLFESMPWSQRDWDFLNITIAGNGSSPFESMPWLQRDWDREYQSNSVGLSSSVWKSDLTIKGLRLRNFATIACTSS